MGSSGKYHSCSIFMCAKCFAVTFNGLFYIIAVCEMGWNTLYFKVRKQKQSPYISMSSLNTICLRVGKRVITFLNFLEFAFCMFRLASPSLFTMVHIQQSNSELRRSRLRAAAEVSRGRLDLTLLTFTVIDSCHLTPTGTPLHSPCHFGETILLFSIPLSSK